MTRTLVSGMAKVNKDHPHYCHSGCHSGARATRGNPEPKTTDGAQLERPVFIGSGFGRWPPRNDLN
jgi:hypothetical protein